MEPPRLFVTILIADLRAKPKAKPTTRLRFCWASWLLCVPYVKTTLLERFRAFMGGTPRRGPKVRKTYSKITHVFGNPRGRTGASVCLHGSRLKKTRAKPRKTRAKGKTNNKIAILLGVVVVVCSLCKNHPPGTISGVHGGHPTAGAQSQKNL